MAPRLSVVIPFRDEAPSLAVLHAELAAVLDALPFGAEMIFVDDESRDDGAAIVARLAAGDPRVRLLALTPHAGQSAALEAGFRAARGELVATMDADLQNDPADLPALLAGLAEADCVCGVRVARRDALGTRLASRAANAIRRRVLGDGIEDIGCSLRVMRRSGLERIKLFRGGHRFLPVLLALEGARVAERPVRHRPRRHGRSKYGVLMRLRVVWADLLGVAWLARRVARYEVKELSRRA
ncbi:MAG: glycosyltransferase family 2 protein [Deltaproteobacteria bacterium]|nr:glycosyltransferase family 2 protein [Deltaproteobacteria bacterium]